MTFELYREIGKRIEDRRKYLGMQQERLAEILGYSRTSISNIENGKQKLGIDVLYTIAGILSVDVHTLLPDMPEDTKARIQEAETISAQIEVLLARRDAIFNGDNFVAEDGAS